MLFSKEVLDTGLLQVTGSFLVITGLMIRIARKKEDMVIYILLGNLALFTGLLWYFMKNGLSAGICIGCTIFFLIMLQYLGVDLKKNNVNES